MQTLLSRRQLIAAGGLATALSGLSLWRTQNPPERDHDLPVITCTVGMITDVARAIGGDDVHVIGLMGAGVDPHSYKPSAGDIQRLGDADLILYGGLHLEGRMTETLETVHESDITHTVAVSETLSHDKLISSSTSGTMWDPHVWMDVTLWRDVAGAITHELAAVQPEAETRIRERGADYHDRLTALDTWAEEQLHLIPSESRVLVTAHDAFNYFGRRYDVEVMGLQGLSSATEAGAGDVQALADLLSERRIPAIFIESSIPPNTIEAVQAATRSRGWDVRIGGELYADAMGATGTPDGTYIGMMRHNVQTIVEALHGETF